MRSHESATSRSTATTNLASSDHSDQMRRNRNSEASGHLQSETNHKMLVNSDTTSQPNSTSKASNQQPSTSSCANSMRDIIKSQSKKSKKAKKSSSSSSSNNNNNNNNNTNHKNNNNTNLNNNNYSSSNSCEQSSKVINQTVLSTTTTSTTTTTASTTTTTAEVAKSSKITLESSTDVSGQVDKQIDQVRAKQLLNDIVNGVDIQKIVTNSVAEKSNKLLPQPQQQPKQQQSSSSETVKIVDKTKKEMVKSLKDKSDASCIVINGNHNTNDSKINGHCEDHYADIRRHEMIIRENTPIELPPDVVRHDAKIDDGLESLRLNITNIRQRFESEIDQSRRSSISPLPDKSALQRSESLQIRLARYQSAAIGERMSDNRSESSSDESSDNEGTGDANCVRESKKKEKVPFAGLSSLRSQWESGTVPKGENPSDDPPTESSETKDELFKLRQKICLGRSASMRQMYEKACNGSNKSVSPLPRQPESLNIESSAKATLLKEKFEKGQIENDTEEGRIDKLRKETEEDLKLALEAETAARDAKSLFKQMDASLVKSATNSSIAKQYNSHSNAQSNQSNNNNNTNRIHRIHAAEPLFKPAEVVKCADPKEREDVVIDSYEVKKRYKFFETYVDENNRKRESSSPTSTDGDNVDGTPFGEPRVEILPDANIVHQNDIHEDIPKIETTSKMLNKFKQLENQMNAENQAQGGPKPLKRITPPREFTKDVIENEHPVERDPNIVRSSYKTEDIVPVEPKLARSLTAKFENWSSFDMDKENTKRDSVTGEEEVLPQVDITKNLRAKFEAIHDQYIKPVEKSKPKVNRFVNEFGGNAVEDCSICRKRLYPMEKLEFSGMKMHKNCFKCSHCSSSLRLENYTQAAGKFYCIIHFKQLFMAKGNYDEGFGVEQHKEKWLNRNRRSPQNSDSDIFLAEDDDKESNYTDQITV